MLVERRVRLRLLILELIARSRRESHHVRQMHFDRNLVTYRPVNAPSLFEVEGCAGREAQPVKYLASEEFALFHDRQSSSGL